MRSALSNPVKRISTLEHHATMSINFGAGRGHLSRAGDDPGVCCVDGGGCAKAKREESCFPHPSS